MAISPPSAATGEDAPWRTHTVSNQPSPLTGVDVFSNNIPLVEATHREGAGWVTERAAVLGKFIGGAPQEEWGRLANENKPVLHTHDRYGKHRQGDEGDQSQAHSGKLSARPCGPRAISA